jgi:cytochrome P450
MIDRWTTWFIDEIIETGSCDLASVIGVPAVVTLDWLGLDVSDWRRFTSALHAPLAEMRDSEAYRRAVEEDVPWMQEQINEAIRRRRAEPTGDVISYFLDQSVDGRPITDEEVYSIVELLISGGVGTTASLVSQTLVHLSQHPEQRQRLIDEPALIERAVEEFLRAFSPTQAMARTVLSDVDFHGCPMHTGDRVLLAWSSANRDPGQFEDADEVVLDRWPNRHTAFGMGVHRCAGAHLARAMARTMIGQIIERMPDFVVDVDAARTYPHQGVNAGYVSIPATFTPGARRGSGGAR